MDVECVGLVCGVDPVFDLVGVGSEFPPGGEFCQVEDGEESVDVVSGFGGQVG